jgi:plasmid stabilization system protein ParE
MQVRWSTEAADDVARVAAHIREDRPDAALRVVKSIYERAGAMSA